MLIVRSLLAPCRGLGRIPLRGRGLLVNWGRSWGRRIADRGRGLVRGRGVTASRRRGLLVNWGGSVARSWRRLQVKKKTHEKRNPRVGRGENI